VLHRDPHAVHFLQREPERLDGAAQDRGESQVEIVPFGLQEPATGPRLADAFFRQVDVGPAGKAVFAIPVGLAVTEQN